MSPLLRPAVRCPNCSATPRWRIPDTERDRYADVAPNRVVATYQCHRCHVVYDVTAEAYQRAA
jgi:hypothetical protein